MAPTSHYFSNFSATETNTIRMYEELVDASIKISGMDCWYIPRESFDENDFLFGENARSRFRRAYMLAMYLANVEGYEGDGDFFSKFGLQIRDTTNLIVSRLEFEKYIPSSIATRAREGDLIFVPTLNKLFEIKFVEEELLFFSLGKRSPYIYEMRCEMFRYSNEQLETGVDVVDQIERDVAYTVMMDLSAGTGNYNIGEMVYQGANLVYSIASAKVSNWEPITNQIYIQGVKGVFSSNTQLIGATSNTRYNTVAIDTFGNNSSYDISDNEQVQVEANVIIDLTEVNPFGYP